MHRFLSVSAAVLCLFAFSSCSSSRHADLATFKLRDLTRFGRPQILKISKKEVQELEQAERGSRQVASLGSRHQARIPVTTRAPVDYVPPSLPDGALPFDGSILPPKTGGNSALLDVRGSVPGQRYTAPSYPAPPYDSAIPQNFSIE